MLSNNKQESKQTNHTAKVLRRGTAGACLFLGMELLCCGLPRGLNSSTPKESPNSNNEAELVPTRDPSLPSLASTLRNQSHSRNKSAFASERTKQEQKKVYSYSTTVRLKIEKVADQGDYFGAIDLLTKSRGHRQKDTTADIEWKNSLLEKALEKAGQFYLGEAEKFVQSENFEDAKTAFYRAAAAPKSTPFTDSEKERFKNVALSLMQLWEKEVEGKAYEGDASTVDRLIDDSKLIAGKAGISLSDDFEEKLSYFQFSAYKNNPTFEIERARNASQLGNVDEVEEAFRNLLIYSSSVGVPLEDSIEKEAALLLKAANKKGVEVELTKAVQAVQESPSEWNVIDEAIQRTKRFSKVAREPLTEDQKLLLFILPKIPRFLEMKSLFDAVQSKRETNLPEELESAREDLVSARKLQQEIGDPEEFSRRLGEALQLPQLSGVIGDSDYPFSRYSEEELRSAVVNLYVNIATDPLSTSE